MFPVSAKKEEIIHIKITLIILVHPLPPPTLPIHSREQQLLINNKSKYFTITTADDDDGNQLGHKSNVQ